MHNNAINSLKKSYYYNILKHHTYLNKPAAVRYVGSTPSIENHLTVVRGFPPRSFYPSTSTRRVQLSAAAKVVRPTDLLNNAKSCVNTD